MSLLTFEILTEKSLKTRSNEENKVGHHIPGAFEVERICLLTSTLLCRYLVLFTYR